MAGAPSTPTPLQTPPPAADGTATTDHTGAPVVWAPHRPHPALPAGQISDRVPDQLRQ